MLATHTPGPWQALGLGSDLRGANGEPIALIHVLGSAQRETGEANARLIAEAPAMLAALRALVDQCEATSAWDDALAGEDPQMLADVENARAILARIDGEA